MRKLNLTKLDLLIIAIILIAYLKFTFGMQKILDIDLWDESTFYLYPGVKLWNVGLPSADYSPLYAIWYFILSLFVSDRIALFYLNYKLMMISLSVLTYILLRSNKVSIPVCLSISWCLLVSHACATTQPRVSHFALIFILVTVIVIGQKRSILWGSFMASIGALLVSFIRPEYLLTYILAFLVFLFLFMRDSKKLEKRHLVRVAIYGLFSASVLRLFGLPISENRSIFAFGQHFSLNWVYWTHSDMNPWSQWKEIITQNFGNVHSIPEAFVRNPFACLTHIGWNLLIFFARVLTTFFPANIPLNAVTNVVSLLMFILVIGYFRTHGKMRLSMASISKKFQEQKTIVLIVGLFLLPTMISIILIYPRDHYLLMFDVLIVIITILLINNELEQKAVNLKKLSLLCLFIIVVTPRFNQIQITGDQPNLRTIEFIQSLEINEPINLLDADGNYNVYLGDNFHIIEVDDKNSDFERFRATNHINMVIVSNTLLKDARFKNDPEWQAFLANYRQFGYLQLEIPNTDRKIIAQTTLGFWHRR